MIVVVGIMMVLPLLTPKPNLRPESLPPRVQNKHDDGWFDLEFEDLGVVVRVPGRPASQTRRLADESFHPDFASDYIQYACTGDGCVVTVDGIWLSPPAVGLMSQPGALTEHADDNYNKGADRVTVKGLPSGAEARHMIREMPGYPPNNSIMVTILRRNNLLVHLAVNTSQSKEVAVERMEKVLAGYKLTESPAPE